MSFTHDAESRYFRGYNLNPQPKLETSHDLIKHIHTIFLRMKNKESQVLSFKTKGTKTVNINAFNG